eukprot:g7530.t1
MGSDSTSATPTPGARPKSACDSARGGDNGGGGVKVVVRTRPANQFELLEEGNKVCFRVVTEENCMIEVQGKSEPYTFTFDHVFDQKSRQISVFEAAGIPTVDNVLAGYNSTIFAYGQTGAGKTHTMVGNIKDEEQRGLTPRVFEYLFKRIKEEEATQNPPPQYKVICSNLEIYNETITDLLTPNSTNLPLRNDTKLGSGTYVDGLKEVEVKCCKDAMNLMEIGTNSRTVSATNANLTSSRSHCVYTCVITRKQKSEDGSENTRVSRLNLVDLAGSERAKVSEGKNAQTLKEGCNINKSLTCLGRVIKELVEAQRKGGKVHVPYRDSKLTSLLQESLGGNARTTIIAGVSPMYSSSGESLSTLQFVQRAKHIKNKAKANEVLKQDPVALQMEVMKLRAQIEKMKKGGYRRDPNDRSSVSCTPEPDPELENKIRENEEKIEELEAQLEEAQFESSHAADQNRKMESENQYLRDLKTRLQTNINDMMTEFSFLQERLNEAEQITNNVLEAERFVYEEKLEAERQLVLQKESEKQERDAKITKLEEELRDLVSQLGALQEANKEMQSTLDITNATLNSKTNELEKLNKEHMNVKSALKDSEVKCEDLDSKLIEANGQVKEQKSQLASLQSELERTIAKSDEFESDNARLKETIESLETTRSEIKRKLHETELYVQQLEREKQDLKTEVECQEQKCGDLEEKLSAATEQMKEQRGQIASLQHELKHTSNKADEFEVQNSAMKQTIKNLEEIKAESKRKLNETEILVQKLEREKLELTSESECWQQKYGDLDVKLTDAYEQLKEHRSQLSARDNEVERVQFKLEQCETDNAGLRRNVESLETTRAELKKKLNETELLAQKLERQKEDLEADVECWQNKGGDLDSKLADAYEQLKEQRAQLTARVNELESIQTKADEFENENAGFKQTIENLEDARSELKRKLNETELLVKTLKREKEDLGSEVQCWQHKSVDLERKLSDANEQLKEQKAQLSTRETELDRINAKADEYANSNAEYKENVADLEDARSELKKKVHETEILVQKLEREKTELGAVVEMVQKQREDLQTEVERYVALSKTQKGDAASLKTKFDRTCLELQEEITEKEKELQRAEENCKTQLAARDAKLAEVVRRHEEVMAKRKEEYEDTVQELRASINKAEDEKENKFKQFIEDKKEMESRHKVYIENLAKTSIESDKQMSEQLDSLRSTIHKKETELREVTAKCNSDLTALRCRLEEETSRFQAELAQRESTCADEIFQIKQDSRKQILRLEESVRKYKELASEKQTVIEFHETRIQEIKEEYETRIKKEVERCRTEINYHRIEAEEFSSKAENENNAKFRQYEDYIRSLERELENREHKIVALEDQLEVKEGNGSYYFEEYNQSYNREKSINNTLLSVLDSINNTLVEFEVSRPNSAAGSIPIDDDRRSYDSDYLSYGMPLSSSKLSGRYPSSSFYDSSYSRYTPTHY